MSEKRDDWEKPRGKGDRLTVAEIEFMRQGYIAGRISRDGARDLKCSSRVASKYYSLFNAEGVRKGKRDFALRLPSYGPDSTIEPPSKARLMGGR